MRYFFNISKYRIIVFIDLPLDDGCFQIDGPCSVLNVEYYEYYSIGLKTVKTKQKPKCLEWLNDNNINFKIICEGSVEIIKSQLGDWNDCYFKHYIDFENDKELIHFKLVWE